MGWSLVQPYRLPILKNRSFEELTVSDIVKLITKAEKVNIILAEMCLSGRIISELEWVSKYIDINIIAKDENIISRYNNIKFASEKIDSSIDINHLGIFGEESLFVIVSDFFLKIDDSIEKIYFNGASTKANYDFLKDTTELYVLNDGSFDCTDILSHTIKNTVYVVSNKMYDKELLSKFEKTQVKLLISDKVQSGVFIKTKDSLLRVSKLKNTYMTYPIESFYESYGNLYEPLYLSDFLQGSEIPSTSYSCTNNGIRKMNIEDKKILEFEVAIPSMDDFVNEKIDSRIVDNHNIYSAEAKKVEYQFTLIPPIFDSSYGKSSIYDDLYELHNELSKIRKYNANEFLNGYTEFTNRRDISSILQSIDESLNKFEKEFKYYDFSNFHYECAISSANIEKINENYLNYLMDIYNEINDKTDGVKFDKFDNEIAGYQQTIAEKQALLDKKIDALSNKRRIDSLKKKIEDLMALKKRFESTSSQRTDKGASEFKECCEKIINGTYVKPASNEESIGTIIKQNSNNKVGRLYSFVEKSLKEFVEYIRGLRDVFSKITSLDIPFDYTVYDKDGVHYIVIDDLEEYEKTSELREKYNLKCVARRG